MLFGAAGQAVSMAILSGTTSVQAGEPNSAQYGIAAAVFLFVFNSFFAVGWLGMTCTSGGMEIILADCADEY